jgi:hypothetical protein
MAIRNLKRLARVADAFLSVYGLSPIRTVRAIQGTPAFLRDLYRFSRHPNRSTDWIFGALNPYLTDRGEQSGVARGHYFHQDLLVAQRIFQRNPRRHIDVGSRFDGFVAHVASFRPIEFADIRPLSNAVRNVQALQFDLMAPLRPDRVGICDSLSCLHVLEHLGLGRYGDCIDPQGHRRGFRHLVQMLEPGGLLYFSVPIGRQRIEFNAHRVFGLQRLLQMFQDENLELVAMSYVDDNGDLVENVQVSSELNARAEAMNYGCGIFELRKAGA